MPLWRIVAEAVAQASSNTIAKIRAYFVTAVTQAFEGGNIVEVKGSSPLGDMVCRPLPMKVGFE
jgi:hypothetical protein